MCVDWNNAAWQRNDNECETLFIPNYYMPMLEDDNGDANADASMLPAAAVHM